MRWVSGHLEIAGNELADKLIKQGAELDSPLIPPSPSFLVQEPKQQLRADTYAVYIKGAPQAYQELDIRPYIKGGHAQEHKLPRWVLDRLIAACTGHRDFTAYHERF